MEVEMEVEMEAGMEVEKMMIEKLAIYFVLMYYKVEKVPWLIIWYDLW